MANENRAIARRYFEEFLNNGDSSVADAIFHPGVVLRGLQTIRGLVAVKRYADMTRNAFPDLRLTVEDEIAEGDKVVSRFTMQGTHKGAFLIMAPTYKQVNITGVEIFRITKGKIEEVWAFIDAVGLMQQLGILQRGS